MFGLLIVFIAQLVILIIEIGLCCIAILFISIIIRKIKEIRRDRRG